LAANDYRQAIPRFAADNAAHNAELVKSIQVIADNHGVTTGQVALAWLVGQREARDLTVVPIPGTTNPRRLTENAAAATVRLSAADMAALDPIAAHVLGEGRPPLPPGIVNAAK
jgi:aryl-alcohol dehydrogenase-like predicted oxidoreductase